GGEGRRRPWDPAAFRGNQEAHTMRCDLSGKVSLVTGAARGIGRAIADLLAANGSRVVYTDVNEAGIREVASAVPGALARVLDVTQTAEIERTIEGIAAACGRLDSVVNKAG